jgi:hypothetical protein
MINDTFFNFEGTEFIQTGEVILDELCNGLNVINIGTTVCMVNGIPLSPPAAGESVGDSYTIGGNRGEILQGHVSIAFVGGTGLCIVVQKFYLKKC